MKNVIFVLGLSFVASMTTPVSADFMTYDLVWDGSAFGNSATATGSLTWDPDTIGSGTTVGFLGLDDPNLDLVVEVENAVAGNGTFFDDEFGLLIFESGPGIDFSDELVGQSAFLGLSIISFDASGPNSVGPFTITTPGVAGSPGDTLELVSFAPQVIPEPSSVLILTFSVGLLATRRRR